MLLRLRLAVAQCFASVISTRKPGAHHDHGKGETHYCRANLAYKVNRGNYRFSETGWRKILDRQLTWVPIFRKVKWIGPWFTFDKPLNKEQRDAYCNHRRPSFSREVEFSHHSRSQH